MLLPGIAEWAGVIMAGTNEIQRDVGALMGILVNVLAFIMNFIMNVVSSLTVGNSLGITIIFTTLLIRLLMLPQAIQAQRSSAKMREIAPEAAKIKKKYGDSKDPEIMRKVNAETQELYRKNKINPLSGCLPLLITMPIFIAFIDLMRRLFLYLDVLRDLYTGICEKLIGIPGMIVERVIVDNEVAEYGSALYEIALRKAQASPNFVNDFISKYGDVNINRPDHLLRFLDTFSASEWEQIKAQVTDPAVLRDLNALLQQRESIQTFLGLNLVNAAGLGWPGIMIPIFSGATSFLLSFITTKTAPMTDQSAKMNQMVMMIAMPAMMFFFTINISGGVGVYWIAGNLIAIAQQMLLAKFLFKKRDGGDIPGRIKEKK